MGPCCDGGGPEPGPEWRPGPSALPAVVDLPGPEVMAKACRQARPILPQGRAVPGQCPADGPGGTDTGGQGGDNPLPRERVVARRGLADGDPVRAGGLPRQRAV